MSLAALLVGPGAQAQPPAKVPRIGYLTLRAGPTPREEAFLQGLRETGWVVGRNAVIEFRYAAGKAGRLPELAAELVRLKVDVFVTSATPPTLAAKEASGGRIPIVMAAVGDPVATGLVSSLARPGGNITGFTVFSSELMGKRLELLKEAARVSHVAVLATRSRQYPEYTDVWVREAEAGARTLRLRLRPAVVTGPREFAGAFSAMVREGVGAVLVQISPVLVDHRQRIVKLAARHRLPAMYESKDFVDVGGLMSYGPNPTDLYRRAAVYVDKILKGAKPADLPIQQPTRLELIVNLKTASALGLKVPPSVLVRADQVIQ